MLKSFPSFRRASFNALDLLLARLLALGPLCEAFLAHLVQLRLQFRRCLWRLDLQIKEKTMATSAPAASGLSDSLYARGRRPAKASAIAGRHSPFLAVACALLAPAGPSSTASA